jgi:hypothetical protein
VGGYSDVDVRLIMAEGDAGRGHEPQMRSVCTRIEEEWFWNDIEDIVLIFSLSCIMYENMHVPYLKVKLMK